MARKRILSTLDTSIAYEAVGLDLAKTDMTLAAFDSDHKEPYFIDRIPYDKLYELLANMAPTLVAMEPCSGAHQIAEQIQALGHEVMMISGRHVQAWVKDHYNGQKTDLNDAFAILNLAYDRWLTPIRGKTREECRLLALQASYRQLKGQRTKTMVHVKATLHAWGFPIRTGSFNQKALRELIDANREAFGGEMAETLHLMIDRVRGLDHDIATVLKLLTEATKRDPRAFLLRSIPGFGVLTTSRWCAVMGDIARFDSPKQTMAFIGLVPNNRITGHHTETSSGREARGQGRMSKRGDKMLRSLCILGAASLCMLVRKDRLQDCPFVASIKARLASPRPWFKVLVYVAAKLVRIATALLKYGEKFSFEKAGISKAVLKQWELEQAKAA